jgi:hypothetical protein
MPAHAFSGPVGRRLFVVIALVYLLTAKGYLEVSDTTCSLQTAESIVLRGRLDIPPRPGMTMQSASGLSYSKYGIGLGLAYTPLVAVSQLVGRASGLPPTELAGFLISFFNIPFGLLTLVLFGQLLREFGTSVEYARLLTAGLALGTLCWRYAVYDFSEGMQAALLLLSIYGAVGASPVRLTTGGLAFCGLVLVKVVNVVFLPVFAVYLVWHPGVAWKSRRRAMLFLAPVLLSIAIVGLLNIKRFSKPLETGYGAEAKQFYPSGLPSALPRLIGSFDSGILVYCPVLVLGVAGWPLFFRRYPRQAAFCMGLLLTNLLLAGSWNGGWGIGSYWGPRPLVQAVPLWLLPAALLFSGCPSLRVRAGMLSLMLISCAVQVPGVLVNTRQIKHVKTELLTEPERQKCPADLAVAWAFLGHKLTHSDELYSVAELGIAGDRLINLAHHRTFQGINVWTEQIARNFKKPALRYLPLGGLAIVMTMAPLSRRKLRRHQPEAEPDFEL